MKHVGFYKKAAAFSLAMAMALSNIDGTAWRPSISTNAAAGNNIVFLEKISADKFTETPNTIVVAGYDVKTKITMKEAWSFDATPFSFFRANQPVAGTSSNLNGDGGNQQIHVKDPLAVEGTPTSNDWMLYTVTPNLSVSVTEGYGRAAYLEPGSGSDRSVPLTVTSTSPLSVSSNSSITFSTVEGETQDAAGVRSLSFGTVGAASGTWASLYDGAFVDVKAISDYSFTVIVRSKNEINRMELVVKSSLKSIPAGAAITLNYSFDPLNEMTLTAVSQERAVTDVKTNMNENLTGASATGEKLPYLQFAGTDTQYGVNGQFKLLNEFYKYNAPMKIDWSLVDQNDSAYITLQRQQGSKQIVAQVHPISETDKIVNLKATIGFQDTKKGKATTEVIVPITIVGTGSRPSVEILKAYNGYYDGRQIITDRNVNNAYPAQMEVYDGSIPHVAPLAVQQGWPPYQVQGTLKFGVSKGRATSVKVSATGTGKLEFRQDGMPNGRVLDATGVTVQNSSTSSTVENIVRADFVARESGAVKLKIEFSNASGVIAPAYTYDIEIRDHRPRSDASLKSLDLTGIPLEGATDEQLEAFRQIYIPNGAIAFGFQSDQEVYSITVPDVVEKVTLKPVYTTLSTYPVDQKVIVSVEPVKDSGGIPSVDSGTTSQPITLQRDGLTTISLTAKAEDGSKKTYVLKITRSSQSVDSSLQDIQITRTDAQKTPVTISPKFNASTFYYTASVPYSVEQVNVKAIATSSWGSRPEITSDGPQKNFISRLFENASNKDILLTYDDSDPDNIKNVTTVRVNVKAENTSVPAGEYVIQITRNHPDRNSQLGSLKLLRDKENTEVKLDGLAFDKAQRVLSATVPYSTASLRLDLLPDSELAQQVRVQFTVGNKTQTLKYINKGSPLVFPFAGLAQGANPDPALNQMVFTIWVTAEDGSETDPPYVLTVERAPADENADLTSLTVVDGANNKPVTGYTFIPTKQQYTFSVPYTTESLIVTPVVKSNLSKAYINGKLVTANVPNQTIKLTAGAVTTITVTVLPEAGTDSQKIYTLSVTREKPSNEARLLSLVVNGGTDQQPTPFVPSTTTYSWSIPEGTKNFTITPTAVDANATIMVNGKATASGAASEPIVTTQANTTIQVVVTAQDGSTQKTYTLKITDYNYIKKSDNADLASLKVNYGQIAPNFNPTVLEYEVYVKPTAMSLGVTPRAASSKAKVEVKAGSLKLTQYNDAYTASLLEDEVTFTIQVTSEDGKNVKTYTLHVYRNDEEKSGNLKPISPDLVDFESTNPIIVDISTHAVVDAAVFNKLKTDYPDKTILFKGNDYTLELKGSDMDTLVPYTQEYDLSFSFSTPDEKAITDLLYDLDGRNDSIDPVYLYFDHHGALPAPMKLTVSLGKAYSNETLYWNYYNPERNRIDYYGYVKTNAKGTFSVPVEHFSTYLITEKKVIGAENKSGLDYSGSTWGEEIGAADEGSGGKYNPNTGAGGNR